VCTVCHLPYTVKSPATRKQSQFNWVWSLVGVPNRCTEVGGSGKGISCVPAAGLKIYAAMIDAELDERGYIVPGLGDAGDRAYNTL
jgi:hypothetical protein